MCCIAFNIIRKLDFNEEVCSCGNILPTVARVVTFLFLFFLIVSIILLFVVYLSYFCFQLLFLVCCYKVIWQHGFYYCLRTVDAHHCKTNGACFFLIILRQHHVVLGGWPWFFFFFCSRSSSTL